MTFAEMEKVAPELPVTDSLYISSQVADKMDLSSATIKNIFPPFFFHLAGEMTELKKSKFFLEGKITTFKNCNLFLIGEEIEKNNGEKGQVIYLVTIKKDGRVLNHIEVAKKDKVAEYNTWLYKDERIILYWKSASGSGAKAEYRIDETGNFSRVILSGN